MVEEAGSCEAAPALWKSREGQKGMRALKDKREKQGIEKGKTGRAETKQDNRLLYKILLAVFLAALVIVAGIMIKSKATERDAEKKLEELAAQAAGETDTEESEASENGEEKENISSGMEEPMELSGIEIPKKNLDWEALQGENPDIYAWITVPGTQVDYPVLQHPSDDAYYLAHNLDGSEGYPGCIYTESKNRKDFSDRNTILYGHNMKDGSMFGSLHNFEEESFFTEHRYAFVYTKEQIYVYDLFAAYEFSDDHLLYAYNFASDLGYQEYLDMVFGIRDMGAHLREGVEVTVKDTILTMSTCISAKPENRYLVQGLLLGIKEL